MLTRRGAFRQRGLDLLPKIQTNISQVEAATPTTASPAHDVDAELAEFIRIDDSCLDFLTPTSGVSSSTAATVTATPGGDDDVPWPRPMDRDIHGRSDLKRTAPQWAIQVRLALSRDFEQDSTTDHQFGREDEGPWGQRRPSVVDRRFSYGRKIQAGGGRRPSDFSLRSLPPGLQVPYEDIPFELVLCSEEDSLYSN
ncbi:hypothetical protein INS49_013390 [Diaporthe citri]|uniref:uncharacterized protein n=1 Tax=Diaporthe citri TaxID=83186 RepID=UPI001C81B8B3|nr:uncharacterized protein INS49_013390 [Diaporthe citri]KAG6357513.1 hypothetical protein INS49_013390 [Diaporthe citri]